MKMKIYTILTTLLISGEMILLGCSGFGNAISSDRMDKSFFTGMPCAAPCWYGLEIGKSNESEVMDVLATLKFVDQNEIHVQYGDNEKSISAGCALQPEKICASLDIVSERLRSITSYLNYKTTIAEAIKYLGNPDKVGYSIRGVEKINCVIQFAWVERQLVLTSTPLSGKKGCDISITAFRTGLTDAGLEIGTVDYLPVEDINNLVEDIDLVGDFHGVK
jgi:hypothetical protein